MNLFRILGDMCHLTAILLLPYKLHTSRSAAGVSLKMQELYLVVFVTRYLDLFTRFYSFYNTGMKVTYITLKVITIWMMRRRPSLKASYDRSLDWFRPLVHGVIPCLVLAVAITSWDGGQSIWSMYHWRSWMMFLWSFSLVLEPVAVIPQLLVFRGCTDAGRLGWVYVSLMGAYRALYIPNWVYRARTEVFYRHQPLAYAAAAIQTTLFVIFLLDRRFRVPRHLPPLESGGIDIMGSNSSARERLLPDQDADADRPHQHMETGFDGEIQYVGSGGGTTPPGGDGAATDTERRDEGGGHEVPRRGRWRRQGKGGGGGGGGEALSKIESALLLERGRGAGGAYGESLPPPSRIAGSAVGTAVAPDLENERGAAAAAAAAAAVGSAAAAATADGAVEGSGGGRVHVV